jgi:hypothetical protein
MGQNPMFVEAAVNSVELSRSVATGTQVLLATSVRRLVEVQA